ncbi:hypothetical protein VHEMI09110 [[Torrubiella] hemipterigena]|uniref:NB-ARC domain-containing protein n=1 Tax=[Torrubiella] hemipterigena TaxID=1531966 RepID=A0A0A1TFG6_9HYPO|nr:hypothetical protein VHEMI09110 [[Torrubiella] hemipterigena]
MSDKQRQGAWWRFRKNKRHASPTTTTSSPTPVSPPNPGARLSPSTISVTEPTTTVSIVPYEELTSNAIDVYGSRGPPPVGLATSKAPPVGLLWQRAYEQLRVEKTTLVSEYEKLLSRELPDSEALATAGGTTSSETIPDQPRQQQLKQIIDRGLERMQANTWHFTIAGEEYTIKQQVAVASQYALKAKAFIADAVSACPPASMAWAGICIILPLFTNMGTVEEANSTGLTYVIARMRFYIGLEELRWPKHTPLQDDFRLGLEETLVNLYQSIITFQVSTALRLYSNKVKLILGDMVEWHNWKEMIETVKKNENFVREQFHDLNDAVIRDGLETLSQAARLNNQMIQDQVSIMSRHLEIAEEHLNESITTNLLLGNISDKMDTMANTNRVAKERSSTIELIHYLPLPQNEDFVGRQNEMNKLREMLIESNGYNITALFGLGGIGKTQLALQFAHEIQKSDEAFAVLWMSALSVGAYTKSCHEVIKAFQITNDNGEDAKDVLKRHIISNKDQEWLVILDNVDDSDVLYGTEDQTNCIFEFLPRTNNVRILATTRFRKMATGLAKRNIVEVPQMSLAEAEALLKQSFLDPRQLEDDKAREELIANLTYLPLALWQAISYMNENDITIREYLQMLKKADNNTIELLKKGFRDGDHHDSQSAVATTWIISFTQIQLNEPPAANLLLFLAWIESKSIPISILPNVGSDQAMTSALGTLCGYGFLRKQENGDLVDMHRLVQLATQLWIEEHMSKQMTIETAALHLNLLLNYPYEDKIFVWRQYLPHAKKVVYHASEETLPIADLAHKLASCLQIDGYDQDALDLLIRATRIYDQILVEDDLDRLACQHALAVVYYATGQYGDAIQLLEHLVKVHDKIFVKNDPAQISSKSMLAKAYIGNGQSGDAIRLLQHLIATQEKTSTEDNPQLLLCQASLAIAYRWNGQVEDAIELLEHVVAIQNKTLAEDDHSRLSSLSELANLYEDNERVGDAIQLREYIVTIQSRTYAEDHPYLLSSQSLLASAYAEDGQLEKAIQILEDVVEIQSKILTEGNTSRLAYQSELIMVYEANGQFADAIQLIRQVITAQKETLAEDDPFRLDSIAKLSELEKRAASPSNS